MAPDFQNMDPDIKHGPEPKLMGFAKSFSAYFGGSQICFLLILEVAQCLFSLFWGSQSLCQLILVLAEFVSAHSGFRRVFSLCCISQIFFSLFWVSQAFVQLMLGLAEFCQLIVGLAEFLFSLFWVSQREFLFSLFWISQSCCSAYFVSHRVSLTHVDGRKVLFILLWGSQSFCSAKHRLRIPDQVGINRTSTLAGFWIIFRMYSHVVIPGISLSAQWTRKVVHRHVLGKIQVQIH